MEGNVEGNYDCVVVGGGLGGLLTGGSLAKRGLRTLIIEKNSFLGGRCRSIEWGGFKADLTPKVPTTFRRDPKDTWLNRAFAMLGIDLNLSSIRWHLVSVNKKGEERPSNTPFDTRLGSDAFINFFSVMTGAKLNERQKTELVRALSEMASVSEETCGEFQNVGFSDWGKKNIRDAVVRTFFQAVPALASVNITQFPAGAMMRVMGSMYEGQANYVYAPGGVLMDTMIGPLEKACERLGCSIVKNMTTRHICIEGKRVKGVWVMDNKTGMLHKINTEVVVSDVPLHTALGTILDNTNFTEAELRFIEMTMRGGNQEDYMGFYFLDRILVPPDFPAWTHVFDLSMGAPSYAGDLMIYLGANPWLGASGPPGKQLVTVYMVGGKEGAFGSDYPSYESVRKVEERFEGLLEKIFPGFKKAIYHHAPVLMGNYGRYCYLTHDPNDTVEVKSKAVEGLYFTGDSAFVLGNHVGTEKTSRTAVECSDAIVRGLGRG